MNAETLRIEIQQIDSQIKYLTENRKVLVDQYEKISGENDPFGDPKSLSEEEQKARSEKEQRRKRLKTMDLVSDKSFSKELLERLDKTLSAE